MAKKDNTIIWYGLGLLALWYFTQNQSSVIPGNEPLNIGAGGNVPPQAPAGQPTPITVFPAIPTSSTPPSNYAPPANSPAVSGGGGPVPVVVTPLAQPIIHSDPVPTTAQTGGAIPAIVGRVPAFGPIKPTLTPMPVLARPF